MMDINCLFALPPQPIVFPAPRPSHPGAALLLCAIVPEQCRDAGKPLWTAAAGPGNGPDAPPPRPASLGRLPGLREAAAAGRRSTYTYRTCKWQPMTRCRLLFMKKKKKKVLDFKCDVQLEMCIIWANGKFDEKNNSPREKLKVKSVKGVHTCILLEKIRLSAHHLSLQITFLNTSQPQI